MVDKAMESSISSSASIVRNTDRSLATFKIELALQSSSEKSTGIGRGSCVLVLVGKSLFSDQTRFFLLLKSSLRVCLSHNSHNSDREHEAVHSGSVSGGWLVGLFSTLRVNLRLTLCFDLEAYARSDFDQQHQYFIIPSLG